MGIRTRYAASSAWFLFLGGCGGETLPDDLADYERRCVRMNAQPIERYDADPHAGIKHVYACNVAASFVAANTRPFPEGTVIVKNATKENASYPWLVATARKQGGRWVWDEYTRNFEHEDFVRILADESVCTDCHKRAESVDWIFTQFASP